MALNDKTVTIGFTGPFGSGCSTAVNLLGNLGLGLLPDMAVTQVKLSDILRAEWRRRRRRTEPIRPRLQDFGNQLRLTSAEGGHLASLAVSQARKSKEHIDILIIDGIRNVGEVEWLRNNLGYKFFLFAITANREVRWLRSQRTYEAEQRNQSDFVQDDRRDEDEETWYGQSVQRCIDQSDVMLSNEEQLSPAEIVGSLGKQVASYVSLVAGLETRPPERDEVQMNVAYGASSSTLCVKRHVGAVIVSRDGEPISIGFNENPMGTLPCIHDYRACYRDLVRNNAFEEAHNSGIKCPYCRRALGLIEGPPWLCDRCGKSLERIFFPDRAMTWCTALHAEERAIINAGGRSLRGSTIYTTTFPCFLCSEKIIHAGIEKVIFAEPYPDFQAQGRLLRAGIEAIRFEGIRSLAFHRVFRRPD